ncbi:hypothetical protein Tco_0490509 [Tanacetum coccineum]
MDHSFGSAEEVDHVRILQTCNGLLLSGVFRLTFDLKKSIHYKVVQAGGESGETWIQIYSSETGNWSFCRDRFSYFSFDHFESIIYWNDAFHWLEGSNRGKFFESCGYLLIVCRDDIGFTEFTIYEMMKGSSMWSVRKVVKYNLISKTNTIFDIGSNQMDDDDDAVVFIPPFEVDPNLYKFIPSLKSV